MKLMSVFALSLFLFSCTPEQVAPTPVQPQYHTITEKFYSASTTYIYRIVNGINNSLLTTVSDTVYQTNTSVTFQIEHPTTGSYYLNPCITENYPADTCSVELWIDGIMVASDGNYGFAGINYQW